MAEEVDASTVVLVCRQDFCQFLDRALRSEGPTNFQHGDLSRVCGSALEVRVGGHTEVFVVSTDTERAERLISLLRACPIRAEKEGIFELYTIGND